MSSLSPGRECQLLTFVLGDEEYGIDILRVQEIKGTAPVTAIPRTPRHVKGVMNLRGVVVPVVDLRQILGLDSAETQRRTVVIVVNVGSRIVALVVDSVSDVLTVEGGALEPAPDLGSRIDTSFVKGLAHRNGQIVVALDIERLLSTEQLGVVAA